ncbi:hypothetical protein, variant 1 [Capsaspora owczarzaki ATCC 30864]|uniref:UBX domain-containing protein n=1 Tax=Capsaspora owczarzaki (strain ATCC 30864) TaxID=595528 RepID=A0A0D2WHQ2_CAPO3|nr:hypothetical protein, variant 1 [Capsaspora owczarzaki ATCC 30864]
MSLSQSQSFFSCQQSTFSTTPTFCIMSSELADEVLAQLLSMGYDMDRATNAVVHHHRLTVQDAIDFMEQGEDARDVQFDSQQPVLRLDRRDPLVAAVQAEQAMHARNSATWQNAGHTARAHDEEDEDDDAAADGGLSAFNLPIEPSAVPMDTSTAPAPQTNTPAPIASRFDRESQAGYASRESIRFAEERRRAREFAEATRRQIHDAALADRLERERKVAAKTSAAPTSVATTSNAPSQPAAAAASAASGASLQIRLPNNATFRHQFPASATMSDVVAYLSEQLGSFSFATHALLQAYPARTFTTNDLSATVQELKLCPSAALTVRPLPHHVAATLASPDATTTAPPVDEAQPQSPGVDAQPEAASAVVANPPQHRAAPRTGIPSSSALLARFAAGVAAVSPDNVPEQLAPSTDARETVAQPPEPEDHRSRNVRAARLQRYAQPTSPTPTPGSVSTPHIEPTNPFPPGTVLSPFLRSWMPGSGGPSTTTSPKLTNIPSLAELALRAVAKLVVAGRHKLRSLDGLSQEVGMQLMAQLVRDKQLSDKNMGVFLPCHLQVIRLDAYPYVTNELLCAMRFFSLLQELSIRSAEFVTHVGINHIAGLNNLRVLDLGITRLNDQAMPTISQLPLTVLNLERTLITDSGLARLAPLGATLQHLDISDCSKLTERGLALLAAFPQLRTLAIAGLPLTDVGRLSNFPELRSLNLARTAIVEGKLDSIRRYIHLVHLSLANTKLGDNDVRYLQYLTNLSSLKLPSRFQIGNSSIAHISKLPLTELDLTDYIHVTDEGIQFISALAPTSVLLRFVLEKKNAGFYAVIDCVVDLLLDRLVSLSLSNTKLTSAGIPAVAACTKLEVLQLDRTPLKDDVIPLLAPLTRLRTLSLSRTHLTSAVVRSGAFSPFTRLESLNLSWTFIENQGLDQLRLPMLTTLNLDSTRVTANVPLMLTQLPALTTVRMVGIVSEEDTAFEMERQRRMAAHAALMLHDANRFDADHDGRDHDDNEDDHQGDGDGDGDGDDDHDHDGDDDADNPFDRPFRGQHGGFPGGFPGQHGRRRPGDRGANIAGFGFQQANPEPRAFQGNGRVLGGR